MSKSLRIRTTPGGDDEYIKIDVDIEQKFDFLEILSLKISQAEEYGNFCAEYGVIAGRVIINNGFGVPNVKVSIFVPVEQTDLDNDIIKEFYPYSTPDPSQKNGRGIRYNLLPDQQNTLDHTPVGTFREKRDTLDNDISLEIYEKYYKYTTTTNESGDYILFGVPVGEHMLHYDLDISDMGFLSSRPYELIAQGFSEKLFTSRFKFKSSNNLNSLTQIISENLPITVEPYWCDSLSVGSTIGINRRDISIDQFELIPSAIFFGSIFSDDEKDSVNKNCRPDRDMGEMKEVITNEGKLEAIRRNFDGGIEIYDIDADAIDENGNWSLIIPMNLRKVITDEFGDLIPSPDGIKGVASEADLRFKVSMDKSDTDKRLRERAKFLVPNLTGNYNFGTYSQPTLKISDDFKINRQLSEATLFTPYSADTTNQYNYLEDFFTFRWKKVYTVKQYIGRYQKIKNDEGRSFIGIKDIMSGEGVSKFPTNRSDTNVHILYSIICFLVTFFALLIGLINGIIMFLNGLITKICSIKFPVGITVKLTYCFRILTGFCNKAYKKIPSGCEPKCKRCKRRASTGDKCNGTRRSEFKITLFLKWKCVLGGALCKKCKGYCPKTEHSCCIDVASEDVENSPTVVPNSWKNTCPTNRKMLKNAKDGPPSETTHPCCCTCCLKIPLIILNCHEEDFDIAPSIIKTPFASKICNETFVVPFCCTQNCGGPQTALIKDWVSCVMEPIAVWLKMLKFDFYNDWVSGSLYFPLIKRKYKVKKKGKKFGQIKKDKYCDFDCIIRDWITKTPAFTLVPDTSVDGIFYPGYPTTQLPWKDGEFFQGPPFYDVHRVKIRRKLFRRPIVVDQRVGSPTFGCRAQIKGSITTEWFGTLLTTQTENLNKAASTIILYGKDNAGNGCQITFKGTNAYTELETIITSNADLGINIPTRVRSWTKRVSTKHGKPDYVKTEDPVTGMNTWVNIGGHGHHRNICNRARLVERNEYFKESLDCLTQELIAEIGVIMNTPNTDDVADGEGAPTKCESTTDCIEMCPNDTSTCSISVCCQAKCGSNGVKACNLFCNCEKDSIIGPEIGQYKKNIYHGMVVMGEKDNDLYYAVSMKIPDPYFNTNEYKANLFYPVTISELGSSTYCDIDEAPFIMDQLVPTTFNVSMEGLKYKLGAQTVDGQESTIPVTKIEDKDGVLNLRAYVEFSCLATVCLNTMGTVNHSQIGVELIDKNDMGIEIGNCWTRFDHDDELREYFCKRFSSYKNEVLDVWYQKPGSAKFENQYSTYAEIQLHEGYDLTYQLPQENGESGEKIPSEYNDGEFFIPGDACGYRRGADEVTSELVNNPLGQPNPPTNVDYFYGLAPGVTTQLTTFPNDPSVPINIEEDPDFNLTSSSGYINNIDIINYIDNNDSVQDDAFSGNDLIKAIRFNRSQTPYFFYFGLVPGRTSLHKVVGKFFADKINAITLEGVKPGEPSQNKHNKPGIGNPAKNLYSIYKTCLGEAQLPIASPGYTPSGDTFTFESSGFPCDISLSATTIDEETQLGEANGRIVIEALGTPNGDITWTWSANIPSNTPLDTINLVNTAFESTATYLSPDTYTISVIDEQGCIASISVTIGAGEPTCCQTVKLIKATVPIPEDAYGAEFCWSPCLDINVDGTIIPPDVFFGTHPLCGEYSDPVGYPCGSPDMVTTTTPYATSARCATYPGSLTVNYPSIGAEYPLEFYLCTCDEIRRGETGSDIPGDLWDGLTGGGHLGIKFQVLSEGNFCRNKETRLPESVDLGHAPCYPIFEYDDDNPIDFIDVMGVLIDDGSGFATPQIDTPARVMSLEVNIPPYRDDDCPCPAILNLEVYGGTMNIQDTGAETVFDVLDTDGGVFNGGLPCVRAMIRIMKPTYDVMNYETTPTEFDYPNILVTNTNKQRAIDYTQQEWYDNTGDSWDGKPTEWEHDTATELVPPFSAVTFPWGSFTSGSQPPEICGYQGYIYPPFTTPPCTTAPGWCVELGGCQKFSKWIGTDLERWIPATWSANIINYWYPKTGSTITGLMVWDYFNWEEYHPHINPNNINPQDTLTVGDYVTNLMIDSSVSWSPGGGGIAYLGCPYGFTPNDTEYGGSNPPTDVPSSYSRCCNSVLVQMLWTPDIMDTMTTWQVLNPVGEAMIVNGNEIHSDLNNSLLQKPSVWTPPTGHEWLHVDSVYNSPVGTQKPGHTGNLQIKLHKVGKYIVEIALFQYNNGEYNNNAGFGSEDCYVELTSCTPADMNNPCE